MRPALPRTWRSPSCHKLLSQTPPPSFCFFPRRPENGYSTLFVATTTTNHGSRLKSQESSFPKSPPPSSAATSCGSPPPPPFDTYSPTASSSSSSLSFLSFSLATAPRHSPLPADEARHPGI